jgi:hypothetical protein
MSDFKVYFSYINVILNSRYEKLSALISHRCVISTYYHSLLFCLVLLVRIQV